MIRATAFAIGLTSTMFAGGVSSAQTTDPSPVVKIEIARTVQAVNYKPGQSAKVDFRGTEVMPLAAGRAKIKVDTGATAIDASFEKMDPPAKFGPYLVYVLWAITPEGRTNNLGELPLDKDRASITATTRLASFGLIVTAEPYFAVSNPSPAVVLENAIGKDLQAQAEPIKAQAELFQRGQYAELKAPVVDPKAKIPADLYQARNAAAVALAAHADQYAPDGWAKTKQFLDQAEAYQVSKKGKEQSQVAGLSRQAVQAAEDSRVIAVKRAAEAQLAAERQAEQKAAEERIAQAAAQAQAEQQAATERVAQATAQTQAEAERRAEAERQAAKAQEEAVAARQQSAAAQQQAVAAEQAAGQAAKGTAAAEAARVVALAAEQEAKSAAAAANQSAADLRAQLLNQFNKVLPTSDSARGLIVNLGGLNFPTGQATLTVEAKERLSRFSGLVAAHPDLKFEIEGHTDNLGKPESNLKLSEVRAEAVRDYLVQAGLPAGTIIVKGLGDADPVASNNTTDGRARNRRVEIIVSGEVIATQIAK